MTPKSAANKSSAKPNGILLVGCGKMGGALLAGWKRRRLSQPIAVIEPQPVKLPQGVKLYAGADALPKRYTPAAVVFAVKPQSLPETLPAYRRFADGKTVFLSIAAGKTLRFFARGLGDTAATVRAMPNTPAAIGRGIAVACANPRVAPAQRTPVHTAAGRGGRGRLGRRRSLDRSGHRRLRQRSGLCLPADRMLGRGGRQAAGLPAELATMKLARATVAGSGELARLSSEDAAQLRRNVTSPGGTTEAALKVLMGPGGLAPLMDKAIAAATARSRELAD